MYTYTDSIFITCHVKCEGTLYYLWGSELLRVPICMCIEDTYTYILGVVVKRKSWTFETTGPARDAK